MQVEISEWCTYFRNGVLRQTLDVECSTQSGRFKKWMATEILANMTGITYHGGNTLSYRDALIGKKTFLRLNIACGRIAALYNRRISEFYLPDHHFSCADIDIICYVAKRMRCDLECIHELTETRVLLSAYHECRPLLLAWKRGTLKCASRDVIRYIASFIVKKKKEDKLSIYIEDKIKNRIEREGKKR